MHGQQRKQVQPSGSWLDVAVLADVHRAVRKQAANTTIVSCVQHARLGGIVKGFGCFHSPNIFEVIESRVETPYTAALAHAHCFHRHEEQFLQTQTSRFNLTLNITREIVASLVPVHKTEPAGEEMENAKIIGAVTSVRTAENYNGDVYSRFVSKGCRYQHHDVAHGFQIRMPSFSASGLAKGWAGVLCNRVPSPESSCSELPIALSVVNTDLVHSDVSARVIFSIVCRIRLLLVFSTLRSVSERFGACCRGSTDGDTGSLQVRAEMAPHAPPYAPYPMSRRAFVQYQIYKGKSALSVKAIHPTFRELQDGNIVLEKQGSLLLEFSQAVSGRPGERKYDWANKLAFALSPAEMGGLLHDLDSAVGQRGPIEFIHDPNIGTQDGGLVFKTLRISEFKEPTKDMYFALEMREKNKAPINIGIAITYGELMVFKESVRFLLSYLMGWHGFVDPSRAEVAPGMVSGMMEDEKIPF
eukprot:jgi/Mesvir1/16300/Mv14228-RA.1